MHHVFGAFILYPDRAELVGPEGVIHVEPKAFAVLRLLVENHDRVVSREEMIEAIWGGRLRVGRGGLDGAEVCAEGRGG